mmetsp:Transcript_64058/g.177052  ORF Transcript_64058/g.177052 Transcript_64058/m.177052 type:complete len:240 (+) Transcript_64058:288-1007(+)
MQPSQGVHVVGVGRQRRDAGLRARGPQDDALVHTARRKDVPGTVSCQRQNGVTMRILARADVFTCGLVEVLILRVLGRGEAAPQPGVRPVFARRSEAGGAGHPHHVVGPVLDLVAVRLEVHPERPARPVIEPGPDATVAPAGHQRSGGAGAGYPSQRMNLVSPCHPGSGPRQNVRSLASQAGAVAAVGDPSASLVGGQDAQRPEADGPVPGTRGQHVQRRDPHQREDRRLVSSVEPRRR